MCHSLSQLLFPVSSIIVITSIARTIAANFDISIIEVFFVGHVPAIAQRAVINAKMLRAVVAGRHTGINHGLRFDFSILLLTTLPLAGVTTLVKVRPEVRGEVHIRNGS